MIIVDNLVYTPVRFVPQEKTSGKEPSTGEPKMSTSYEAELHEFEENGYIFVPDFLNDEETQLLFGAAKSDTKLMDNAFDVADAQGGKSRLTGWSQISDDVYGMVAAAPRVVDRMEGFLGGEVYHYNSKMMLKEPRVGGAWEWHQDYGYWYQTGCLYPYMASCMIALDRATKENGCLQILKGSHHMGRIEHGRFGGQTGADPERVAAALERLELVYCEMEPGTALFFHANLLHMSAQNRSEKPRWSFICSYNAARNNPYKDSHNPRYTPLKKVDDGALLRMGLKISSPDKVFVQPEDDKTAVGERVKA
jgi:ectoine hydroxylase